MDQDAGSTTATCSPLDQGGLDRARIQDAAVSADSLLLFSVPFLSNEIALI
jgi:hypothetical protein